MKWSLVTADKKFSGFFWTQFFGAFNDNFFKNSLVVLVAFRGVTLLGMDSAALVAVAGGLLILPFFLFSPISGQIADKFERASVVRKVKLFEIAIMAFAAIGFYFQSYLMLLGLIFFMGLQSTLFGPIKYSIIPDLVGEDHLTEGNALTELGTFLSILIGTIGGGVASSVPGADWIIGLVLIIFSIVGYLTSRSIPKVPIASPDLKLSWNPFPEYSSLWALIREKKAIFNTVLAISWFWFFGAGVLSVLPVYVRDFLGGNENVVTLFLAMFTIGVGIGSILSEKLSYGRTEIGLVPLGSAGLSIFLFDLYLAGNPWLATPDVRVTLEHFFSQGSGWRLLADFLMMSVSGGVFIVPLYTLLQERSHSENRSRVIAANNIVNAAFMVLATVALIVFYNFELSAIEIFACFALLNLVVCFYIYFIVPEFTLRFYSWVLSRVMYSIETTGVKQVPKEGPFLLVANHISFVDWLIIAGACKRPVSFVMYYKFFDIPVIRRLMKQSKVIPIASQKEDPEITKQAFISISSHLSDGEGICIFPEGTITSDGELNPFRPGVLKMLESNPVPVIPVVLHGLWGSIFSRKDKKDRIHRRKLKIEFLDPIQPKDVNLEKLEEIFRARLTEGYLIN